MYLKNYKNINFGMRRLNELLQCVEKKLGLPIICIMLAHN